MFNQKSKIITEYGEFYKTFNSITHLKTFTRSFLQDNNNLKEIYICFKDGVFVCKPNFYDTLHSYDIELYTYKEFYKQYITNIVIENDNNIGYIRKPKKRDITTVSK